MNHIVRFCDEAWIFIVQRNGEAHVAVVDWEDVEKVRRFTWGMTSNGYAATRRYDEPSRSYQCLQRFLLGPGMQHIDHIDHDTLNNKRSNLRMTSASKNCFNMKSFAGVWFDKSKGRWAAELHPNRKKVWLGHHTTRKQAQQAVVDALYQIDPIAAKHREELMNAEAYSN